MIDHDTGTVWAPRAASMALLVGGDTFDLGQTPDGWWGRPDGQTVDLTPGQDYSFSIDGSEPLADPRSRWLPQGPSGPSRVDDPDAFRWSMDLPARASWPNAVIYELHVGTFSRDGTFLAAVEHLDHLVELGVTHVELMPIAAWSGRFGWGYDGVAWWAPHHVYGTPDELRQLVDECHQRGLAVLLDLVVNHLGSIGAVLDRFGPYTIEAETPWGRAVNLDGPDSFEVRQFILACAHWWIAEYRFDGLRLDAVHALIDTSPIHIIEHMQQTVSAESERTSREIVLIAEWDRHDPTPVLPTQIGGWGIRAHWADDLHHALHVALTGERQGYYADAAATDCPVQEALRTVYLPRIVTGDPDRERSVGGITRDHFVVCSQNHDQIGNRAGGDRLEHLVSPDAALAAAAVALLSPAVPLLFQGQEWHASTPFPYFADAGDADLASAIIAGRRAGFSRRDWDDVLDPCADSTFRRAVLEWDELTSADHASTCEWYRQLLVTRRVIWPDASMRLTTVARADRRCVTWFAAAHRIDVNLSDELITINVARTDIILDRHSIDAGASRTELGAFGVVVSRLPTAEIA